MVSQAYAVNLMEEYVLRGNAAILKCHIPSFVSEYVTVISWIISEDNEELEIKLDSESNVDGRSHISVYAVDLYWYHLSLLHFKKVSTVAILRLVSLRSMGLTAYLIQFILLP